MPRWKVILINATLVVAIVICLANFFKIPGLEKYKINLGLDLQGGSHLALQVNINEYMQGQLENLVDATRKILRDEKIGYLNLKHEGKHVTFDLRDPSQKQHAIDTMTKSSPFYTVYPDQTTGAIKVGFTDQYAKEKELQLVDQSIEIIRRRVDEDGTKEPLIQRQGLDRIIVQVPGAENPEEIKSRLNQTAKLTFHLVRGEDSVPKDKLPEPGFMIKRDNEGKFWEISKRPPLTGENLSNAGQTRDSYGNVAVTFSLDTLGGKIFGDLTKENVGHRFAAVLDDVVINAPVIREPILGGSGQITGNFTVEEATELATLLRAGALPASLTILEERTVGASLGADSIQAGKNSAVLAVVLVSIFMIIYYGFFGLISIVALIGNIILVFAFLTLFNATLTLPGIAGIALTMGIAVDANVLIYERIREEMRHGKTPLASIEQGFDRAFGTIFDSHVTTLVSGILMFSFGSGTIKGFAVTLCIGIACSLFTAVLVAKMLIVWWLRSKRPRKLNI